MACLGLAYQGFVYLGSGCQGEAGFLEEHLASEVRRHASCKGVEFHPAKGPQCVPGRTLVCEGWLHLPAKGRHASCKGVVCLPEKS